MKVFLQKIAILCIAFTTAFSANAQTENKTISESNAYKQTLATQEKARMQEIEQYMADNNVPREKLNEKGQNCYIHHIDQNNQPVYFKGYSNTILASTIKTSKLWKNGGLGLDLQGQGMEISDKRSRLGVWEPGPVRTSHEAFGGRATTRDLPLFAANNGNTEHATHVAGTLIASGATDAATKGMSNQAKLDCYEVQTDEFLEILTAATEGMLVSNHSYGPDYDKSKIIQGRYDKEDQDYDSILYVNKYYLPLFAIGNERNDAKGITWDVTSGGGTAKNSLGIGAVELLPNGYSKPSDVVAADFTNYGPMDDGRIKPDFVAPGVAIKSAGSKADDYFFEESGTSMASPGSAGSLFLLQQHHKNIKNGKFMKSATLKALAIHTCDEAGDATGPDARFGYGLLNLERAIEVLNNKGNAHFMEETSLANGATYSKSFNVGAGPLKVTICWTDLPGVPTADGVKDDRNSKLINDLDVRIIDTKTKTVIDELPWKLNPEKPENNATKGDNTVDNVEQILVDNIPAGTYTVSVTHKGKLATAQEFSIMTSGSSVTVGVSSVSNDFNLAAYPNPTSGNLNINLGEEMKAVKVQIRNLVGQTIATNYYESVKDFTTNIEGAQGVYFVDITNGEGKKASIKVVKQ